MSLCMNDGRSGPGGETELGGEIGAAAGTSAAASVDIAEFEESRLWKWHCCRWRQEVHYYKSLLNVLQNLVISFEKLLLPIISGIQRDGVQQ